MEDLDHTANNAQHMAHLSYRYRSADTPVAQSHTLIELASFWLQQGQFVKAQTCFEQAFALDPGSALAQAGLGVELLRNRDFRHGIPLYDSGRWRIGALDAVKRPFTMPLWDGGPLKGKRVLVWCEQGIGDQMVQVRILPALLEKGAQVTLEADPRLFDLLGPLRARISCVPQTEIPDVSLSPEAFDLQTSALTAWAFLDDPMPCQPYLYANADWAAEYQAAWDREEASKVNIGLSWFSSAAVMGAQRSIDLAWLLPLMLHKDRARFHSLQHGVENLEAEAKKIQVTLCHDPSIDPFKDLKKLAAYIKFQDLVITIDNAVAHLAGALGVKTWLLLPKSSKWYWGVHPFETSMYSTVRLFRAAQPEGWHDVLAELYDSLDAFMAVRSS